MTGVVLFYVFVLLAWDLAQQPPSYGPVYACVRAFVCRRGRVCACMLHQSPTSILPIKHMGGQPVYCVGLQTMLTH